MTAASAVALIGFMGCGKSRIGMLLAHKLRSPFVDTDGLITEQCGPIADIFATQGEAAFRALERDVVIAALQSAERLGSVVALGGGAPMNADVQAALRRLPVVWLTAPVDLLWKRARGSGRPLATSRRAFAELLEARSDTYARLATLEIVNDGSRSADDVVEEILAGLRELSPPGPAERASSSAGAK